MADDLPVLIVGDVHGDLERLFQALKPYPSDAWRTIFLGDLVDYGPFGVGALRYARDRANSVVILGNHDVAMLWALRDPSRIGFWMGIGGQSHDLDELARDAPLQEWLRARPALIQLADKTLVQHCGNDAYATLFGKNEPDPIVAINARVRELLTNGGEPELWDLLSGRNIFTTQPERMDRWLEVTGSRRVVFGHNPHRGARPETYHGGRAMNFDGGFSRFHQKFRRHSPLGATVAPLPPIGD
ncbi:MAG TPA: metallophosphoesterase [Candidatus Dormibacteraeota bacterium]|nr:metallophosphoesterase [Candidatus Dormibacteraeota bacterium]